MVKCEECGIAGGEVGSAICFKFNCPVEETTKMHSEPCPYYIERISEEGEPLTPQQHLLISEQTLSSRHMKGPV